MDAKPLTPIAMPMLTERQVEFLTLVTRSDNYIVIEVSYLKENAETREIVDLHRLGFLHSVSVAEVMHDTGMNPSELKGMIFFKITKLGQLMFEDYCPEHGDKGQVN